MEVKKAKSRFPLSAALAAFEFSRGFSTHGKKKNLLLVASATTEFSRWPFLFILLFGIFRAGDFAQASLQFPRQPLGWRQQSSGVLSKLNAIVFVDRQRGWIAGGNGMLLATENGGQQWQPVLLPPKMKKEPLLDLWAFDEKRLLALGEYGLFNRRPELQWHERVFLLRRK